MSHQFPKQSAPRRGLSLRAKTTAITLSVILLTTSVVATTSLVQMGRQVEAEQHRAAQSVALGVSRASELALAVGDKKELSRVANTFLRDGNVLFVAVYRGNVGDGRGVGGGVFPGVPVVTAARDVAAWRAFEQGRPPGDDCVV